MKLALQSQENGVAKVRIEGKVSQRDLISDTEPLVEALGDDAFGQTVLLDMSEVAALDSSGVNWLLICQRKMREKGGVLILHSLSPIAKNVIKVLNLQSVFKLAETEQQALSHVKS